VRGDNCLGTQCSSLCRNSPLGESKWTNGAIVLSLTLHCRQHHHIRRQLLPEYSTLAAILSDHHVKDSTAFNLGYQRLPKDPTPEPTISLVGQYHVEMAPYQAALDEPNSSKDFFAAVSRDKFPPAKAKLQPWKALWSASDQAKGPPADDKMIVACALRHDYGSSGLGGY